MLVVSLQLNRTGKSGSNVTVAACLSPAAPVLTLNTTENCTTAFSQGYSYRLNAAAYDGTYNIPYPETGRWYLSMQLLCSDNDGACQQQVATVIMSVYLSPCLDDCGPYGECRLLRRSGYPFAACSCKAGWGGWSCTDDRNGLSVAQQLTATMLLTLSNLIFIPTIVVTVYHLYFVEAAVYLYTMFFSTFYHACDQPGVTVMCIMDYDTLQFCDFGSVVAIWVTILCMSRLKKPVKYVLFMLGSLVIAMSMQLDWRGIWNMLGPCGRSDNPDHRLDLERSQTSSLLPSKLAAMGLLPITRNSPGLDGHFSLRLCRDKRQLLLHPQPVAASVACLLPPRERNAKSWK